MEKQFRLGDFNSTAMVLERLLQKKISVLLDGLYQNESYTGILLEVCSELIVVEILGPISRKYIRLYLPIKNILSVLEYNVTTQPIY